MITQRRIVRAVLPAVLVVGGTAAHAQTQQGYTLEQVMSAPFPTELTAGGSRFVWVQNAAGVRNIWVAEGPRYQGRQVTRYTEDDGQDLTSLALTPDGRYIVFVRGGGPNRQGEIPNPTSDPAGARQAIWVVTGAGGEPRRLAEGSSPAVSPGGDVVAFLRRGQVWSVRLADSAAPQQMFEIRGTASSLTWSPDGASLAFVSNRGDHSFIGVYHTTDRSLHYLDPSVDRDGNPVWSPDGRRIAFTRMPNERDRLPFMPQREGPPWSIRVADVATGEGREVWRAPGGRGSVFHAVVGEHQVMWAAGDRLVFPWERAGWVQLYAVPVAGGETIPLTPGAFEVEHVALGRDGREVVYSSNQDDIDRRHIWRVPVGGGRPQAVTVGPGVEWEPAVNGDGAIAFFASDARTPAHAEVIVGGAARRSLAPETVPADFPSRALVEPEQVILAGADGLPIHGQLFRPRDLQPGQRRPAVLFFHGGSRRQMLLGFHYLAYYHNAYALNQYLASRGFVVLSVNYRSGTGYGMEFREALNYGARGASEFHDVLGAGLYLRSRPDVDARRIGLWGGSYGGYLTALGLARASDLFAAGVDMHGVHDWNVVIRNFQQNYDPVARAEVARLALQSSPMASLDTWRSPVLVVHGDDDRNVPFSETVDLVAALRQRGVEVEQLIFPDEVHGFLLHRSWLAAYKATAEFFERRLLAAVGNGR
ncbi:MAG TPA: prolyl oligopeptidase family serine peptidase [Gemmatimonadales bacterium]|nr:prolyl oligopeptidase family serine peptidase [Gemmatimonadales bacterium]